MISWSGQQALIWVLSLHVKFLLYLKKAGLASRNIVHSTLCPFLPLYIFLISMPLTEVRVERERYGVGQRRLSSGSFQKGPENRERTEK